jgi:hypothetical protein
MAQLSLKTMKNNEGGGVRVAELVVRQHVVLEDRGSNLNQKVL